MKIIFKTNIDEYDRLDVFPRNFDLVPRKGEKVMVKEEVASYYRNKRLPTRLEVVDVTYTISEVICELWYNELDAQIAKQNGAKLL